MINNDRIVPIQKIDLLTAISVAFAIVSEAATINGYLAADDVEGDFTVTENSKVYIANQPVKSCNFASGVTAGTVYFVADYQYSGFKVAGTTVTTAGTTVNPDGVTLYKAVLASGAVTISQIGA